MSHNGLYQYCLCIATLGPINGDIYLNNSKIMWSPPLEVLDGILLSYNISVNNVYYGSTDNSYLEIEISDFDYCHYTEVCVTAIANKLKSPNTCRNISLLIGNNHE